jgi:hypothetical protein
LYTNLRRIRLAENVAVQLASLQTVGTIFILVKQDSFAVVIIMKNVAFTDRLPEAITTPFGAPPKHLPLAKLQYITHTSSLTAVQAYPMPCCSAIASRRRGSEISAKTTRTFHSN